METDFSKSEHDSGPAMKQWDKLLRSITEDAVGITPAYEHLRKLKLWLIELGFEDVVEAVVMLRQGKGAATTELAEAGVRGLALSAKSLAMNIDCGFTRHDYRRD